MNKGGQWLAKPQRRIGLVGMLVLLAISNLTMPLSMDMYTPAIPGMTLYFGASEAEVNLTLVLYLVFFSVGLLLFGPISDKVGRKPVLAGGMTVFAVANVFCALAPSIVALIAARAFAAIGAGAVSSVSAAIVKDAFVPEKCEAVLSLIQVLFVTGPILAPLLGALILQVADWRFIFGVLAAIGTLCTVTALLFSESLGRDARVSGGPLTSMGRMGSIVKNKGFMAFLLTSAIFNIPFMAFIAVASYIYMWDFGLSNIQYGLAFAGTSLCTILGPVACMAASKAIKPKAFIWILVGGALVSGVLVLTFGQISAIAFFVTFVIFAVVEAAVRPFSMNLLLAQYDGDAGAISSLFSFAYTAVGSIGMVLAVLPWPSFVAGLGIIIVGSAVLSLIGVAVICGLRLPLKGMVE